MKQHVETTDRSRQTLDALSTQKFNVNAPRFTLNPEVVHSTYPPQGLGDHNNVLPHIVFDDPHFPWEQQGSPRQDLADHEKQHKPGGQAPRTKVPWVALLTFTEDELKLSDVELQGKTAGGLFPDVIQVPPKTILPSGLPAEGRAQDKSVFSLRLTMGEYLETGEYSGVEGAKSPPVITPIVDDNADEKIDRETQVDVIFPRGSHVNALFSNPEADEPEWDTAGGLPNLKRYQYLAHVRNVNTMNVAGEGLSDNGLYSVVHAHRTGPLDLTTARPVIVHLVTLEGIEPPPGKTPRIKLPLDDSTRVAMISLFSWTYLCLPPDEVNFVDSMRDIGEQIKNNACWLRTPAENIVKLSQAPGTVPAQLTTRLAQRMEDGYSLMRHKLQTGEETVSFYRGPLTPRWVPPVEEAWWPFQSNFSTDYQVLDRSLGVMDITYSAAWQLGRTLGIADQSFSAALVRLRSAIQISGRRGALKQQSSSSVKTKPQTLASLQSTVMALAQLAVGSAGSTQAHTRSRHRHGKRKARGFRRPGQPQGARAAPKDVHRSLARTEMGVAAMNLASARNDSFAATSRGSLDDEVLIPFNEINVPKSPDWQIVQSWILDNLFLKNIPAHYFLPDPSYLPPESIRFFYLDSNWLDAFLDGALSIGNHLDRADDVVRQAFKRNLNRYFASSYHEDHPDLKYYPQIPCFGFLLRSSIVKAFPDLEIHAPWRDVDDLDGKREPTLRYEAIEADTLICLFDRMPGSRHWEHDFQITLSQPPHQQCFRLGTGGGLTTEELEFEFRPVYTTPEEPLSKDNDDSVYGPLRTVRWFRDAGKVPVEDKEKAAEDKEKVVEDEEKAVEDKEEAVEDTEEAAEDKEEAAEDKETTEVPVTDVSLPQTIFDWSSRMIVFPGLANAGQAILLKDMDRERKPPAQPPTKRFYDEEAPTSAAVGMLLNSFVSKMKIVLPETTETNPSRLPPDYTETPRQIRLPPDENDGPDDWEVVTPVDSDNDADEGPPPAPGPPAHQAPPQPPPGRGLGLPGNFRPGENPAIPAGEVTHIADPNARNLPPLLGAQFKAAFFALGSGPPPPTIPIKIPLSVSRDRPFDLIVALTAVAKRDTLHNLQLFSVVIDIPVGTQSTDLLVAGDAAAGFGRGRMLANLRFNVHSAMATRPGGQQVLSITLVPRATAKLVPLRNVLDASFVLWRVRLNPIKGLGQVQIQENYRKQDGSTYSAHWAKNLVAVERVQ